MTRVYPRNRWNPYQYWCWSSGKKAIYSSGNAYYLDVRGGGTPKPNTEVIVYKTYHGGNN